MKHVFSLIWLLFFNSLMLLYAQDFRTIDVDKLSDDQIQKLLTRAKESGMSQQQLEAAALARGMSVVQIEKLRKRIALLNTTSPQAAGTNKASSYLRTYSDTTYMHAMRADSLSMERLLFDGLLDTIPRKVIFGSYLFTSKKLTFEPSFNIATPQNYQLGPGDEIVIDIWGASQQNYRLTVNPEGYIFIDNVGPIFVNGLTIEKASKQIIGRLSSIYAGLMGPRPNTFAQVNLGNLRSIKVNIVGEVNFPGTYTLPSLATVFNALYMAGGPTENGTYREIKIIRENKTIATVDLYEFLTTGEQKTNIRLQDQDVILVRPYLNRVELLGEVKTPAFFELKDNETMADLLRYCGGFTDKAYQHRIKVLRKTDKEFSVAEVTRNTFNTFRLQDGDQIKVEPVLNRFANRVEITGAVFRPGIYELTEGMTLRQLIEKADGLREDAFTDRAIIYRLQRDLKTETYPVDLQKLLSDSSYNITLQKEDLVHVFSIFELEEKFSIDVSGEVQIPGTFPYMKNMTLSDAIALAGGFKESASLARVEIARRVKNQDYTRLTAEIAIVKLFNVSKNLTLSDSASAFVLEPYDKIYIRRSPGYEVQTQAQVVGEVLFPGVYTIQSKNERISDLVKRSGGLTPEAYIRGARLYRQVKEDVNMRTKLIKSIEQVAIEDSIKLVASFDKEQFIGIDLEQILKNPGSKYDLLLQDGDRLEIPKRLETVRLSGALLFPITVRYEEGMRLRAYTRMAGGLSPNALPSKAFVIYPNGKVKTTTSFLGIRFYPRIEPGSEIIIPKKAEKKDKLTPQETLAIATSLSSLTVMIITLVNLIK
ncbi:MAG: SLBB domain-containing protein [Bacteroidales bacterium]